MIPSPFRYRRHQAIACRSRLGRRLRAYTVEHLEQRLLSSAQGLDAAFGTAGITLTPFSGPEIIAKAMAFDRDGKLVVVGANERLVSNPGAPPHLDIYGGDAIARYNTDGTLDTSFGDHGKIETPLLQGTIGAQSVAIENDGKILLIGSNGLTRYNTDGSLDAGFGSNGVVVNPGGSSLALQSEKIIVCGGGLHRYNADGSLDTTFGNQGVVAGQGVGEVVVDPHGRIVVASYNKILRYDSDGSPDSSFGNGGQLTVPGSASGGYVALAPDGKIVWTGGTSATNAMGFQVVRYSSDGSLDANFGNGGMVFVVSSGDIPEFPNCIIVQPDEKIVVAGAKGTFFVGMEDEPTRFTGNVFTARLNANGTLDHTWGSGGKAEMVMNDNRQAFAVAEAPSGQIAIAGTDFFVAQFAPSFNQSLVQHAYLNLLARAADSAGLDYFTGLLNRGQISRARLVETIEVSPEYHQHMVEQVYQEYLHRTPDAAGLATWSHFLDTGGTQEQLSASILGSEEFYNQLGDGSETTFLNNLFMDVLQRPIEPPAEQYFSQMLSMGASRTAVANSVLLSPESNGLVVSSGYQTLLGRPADAGGLAVLTDSLVAGATWEELNVAFIASEEYFSGM